MRRFFLGYCHYLKDNELICVMNILIDIVNNNRSLTKFCQLFTASPVRGFDYA